MWGRRSQPKAAESKKEEEMHERKQPEQPQQKQQAQQMHQVQPSPHPHPQQPRQPRSVGQQLRLQQQKEKEKERPGEQQPPREEQLLDLSESPPTRQSEEEEKKLSTIWENVAPPAAAAGAGAAAAPAPVPQPEAAKHQQRADYLAQSFPEVSRFAEDDYEDPEEDDDVEDEMESGEFVQGVPKQRRGRQSQGNHRRDRGRILTRGREHPPPRVSGFRRRALDTDSSSDDDSAYDPARNSGRRHKPAIWDSSAKSTTSTTSSTDDLSTFEGPPEAAEKKEAPPRSHHRFQRNVAIAYVLIIIVILAQMVYQYVGRSLKDGLWIRCLAFLYIPAITIFMMFGVQFIVNAAVQLVGPVAHIRRNSQFYSAMPSPPPSNPQELPSITIQIPVYKESLEGVIMPSIRSLQRALRHYTRKGGKGNIFVNDDGLQVVSEEERARRIAFYERTGISYVARPPDSVRKRRGLFKKASNMNYCLNVSARVEQVMEAAATNNAPMSVADALFQVWSSEEYNREFLAGGDIRVRDLILLVDADTRVPKQCMYKTAPEFMADEQLAFTQHLTYPMRSDFNYWENTIAHFTETIYFAIMFATSGGDTPPLVGHNAFLRWSAVKAVARDDRTNKNFKLYWAEDRVSEDFDLSLRLLTHNYIGRYITYTGTGFQEGVSLTVHDEIIRLKKYAFGACEMGFNRLKDVLACRGIISKSYREFLRSKVPWHSKLNITGYLGTYFAMSCAVLAMWTNIVLYMFVPGARIELVSSLDIILTCAIIFGGLGTVGLGVVKYRLNYRGSAERGVLFAILNELRHAPVLMVFFNAVPFHLSIATFRYFMNLKMHWGATIKEKELGMNCLNYLLTTVKKYQGMYLAMMLMSLGFGALLYMMPEFVDSPHIMVPSCLFLVGHIAGPFILDPTITRMVY